MTMQAAMTIQAAMMMQAAMMTQVQATMMTRSHDNNYDINDTL